MPEEHAPDIVHNPYNMMLLIGLFLYVFHDFFHVIELCLFHVFKLPLLFAVFEIYLLMVHNSHFSFAGVYCCILFMCMHICVCTYMCIYIYIYFLK